MIDYTGIVTATITLLFAIATAFLVPILKQKIGASKLTEMLRWVDIAVSAAEQIFDDAYGETKKNYVMSFLAQKGVSINTDDIDMAIESAVLKLHTELYGKETNNK